MIRFLADAEPAPVLALGFSYPNLELLARDHPILFQVDPKVGGGSFAILYLDSPMGDELMVRLAADHVLALTDEAITALGAGKVMLFDASAVGLHDCSEVMCFAGPDEATIVHAMEASGVPVPVEAFDGLHDIASHEDDCYWCVARRARGLAESPTAAPMPRPRTVSLALAGLIVALATMGTLVVSYAMERGRPNQGLRPHGPSAQTQVIIESDHARREALTEALGRRFELDDAPCPGALPEVPSLAQRSWTELEEGSEASRLSQSWQRRTMFTEGLDVVPAHAAGVGPVKERLHRDEAIDHQTTPFVGDLHVTYVLEAWLDPADEPDATSPPEQAGVVAGRMLVWSYGARAFVCASETVVAKPSHLALPIAGRDARTEAQVKLLLHGVRETMPALRRIRR